MTTITTAAGPVVILASNRRLVRLRSRGSCTAAVRQGAARAASLRPGFLGGLQMRHGRFQKWQLGTSPRLVDRRGFDGDAPFEHDCPAEPVCDDLARAIRPVSRQLDGHFRLSTESRARWAVMCKCPLPEIWVRERGASIGRIGKLGVPDQVWERLSVRLSRRTCDCRRWVTSSGHSPPLPAAFTTAGSGLAPKPVGGWRPWLRWPS